MVPHAFAAIVGLALAVALVPGKAEAGERYEGRYFSGEGDTDYLRLQKLPKIRVPNDAPQVVLRICARGQKVAALHAANKLCDGFDVLRKP